MDSLFLGYIQKDVAAKYGDVRCHFLVANEILFLYQGQKERQPESVQVPGKGFLLSSLGVKDEPLAVIRFLLKVVKQVWRVDERLGVKNWHELLGVAILKHGALNCCVLTSSGYKLVRTHLSRLPSHRPQVAIYSRKLHRHLL